MEGACLDRLIIMIITFKRIVHSSSGNSSQDVSLRNSVGRRSETFGDVAPKNRLRVVGFLAICPQKSNYAA